MKYEIKVMRGGEVVFRGELLGGSHIDQYNESERELNEVAFAIEKAINQQTELRCHIHESN